MAVRTTTPRRVAGLGVLSYATLGVLMLAWGGFWLLVLFHSPSSRGAGLLCGALSVCGLLLTVIGLLLSPDGPRRPVTRLGAARRVRPTPDLGPDHRVDRPRTLGSRVRRPHCRFRSFD